LAQVQEWLILKWRDLCLYGRGSIMQIGSGSYTYEWVENWAKLPQGIQFGYTHGIAEDSQGRIFVHNASTHSVIIFDEDGSYLESWGEEYAAGAHGMLLNREADGEYL